MQARRSRSLRRGSYSIRIPAIPRCRSRAPPEVAAYWALLERDYDEGCGSVFIFDRQSLKRRYKVKANPEVYWHTKTLFHDEAEEEIWANVTDIGNHLIGLVSGPTGWRSHKHKTLNRKYSARIEARLLAVASPRSGLRGPRLLADGARAPGLAQRPVETSLLLVVERIVELLQRRAHAHHRKQHDVEAIRCSGEPTHGAEQRIGGAGTGNKLRHGGRVQPQRFHARALRLARWRRASNRTHDLIGNSRRRLGARLGAPVGDVRATLPGLRLIAAQAPLLFVGERVVEVLQRQAKRQERIVHDPNPILDGVDPFRRLHQRSSQLFKHIPLRCTRPDGAFDPFDQCVGVGGR